MNKSLEDQLVEALDYYVSDPEKRRCLTDEGCTYSGKSLGKDTVGCFVGYFLPEEQRLEYDEKGIGGIYNWEEEGGSTPPQIIIDNLSVFEGFQVLHDGDIYWNKEGLTNRGELKLGYIISRAGLNPEPFKKYLG